MKKIWWLNADTYRILNIKYMCFKFPWMKSDKHLESWFGEKWFIFPANVENNVEDAF